MKKDLVLCQDTGESGQGIALVNPDKLKVVFATSKIIGTAYTSGEKKETLAAARRRVRSTRKRYARRKRQADNLFNLFVILGWVKPEDKQQWIDTDPYQLRVKGLYEALTEFEFSRVLFNFLHHRGVSVEEIMVDTEEEIDNSVDKKIKSNDDDKIVLAKISELSGIIGDGKQFKTIGEYLHKNFTEALTNNRENKDKILCQHIYPNSEIKREFDLIYDTQSKTVNYLGRVPGPVWNKILTDIVGNENRKLVKANGLKYLIRDYIVFYRKPPKSYKPMIGQCSCIPHKKRSPKYCSEFQEYRIWDDINNIRITEGVRVNEPLNEKERNVLKEFLDHNLVITVKELPDLFSIPQAKFSHKANKKFWGNKSTLLLRDIIPGFVTKTNEEKDVYLNIIYEHNKTGKLDSLVKIAQTKWGLTRFHALKLIGLKLETDRCEFSSDALKQINSYMRYGVESLYSIKQHLGFNEIKKINLDKISNPQVKKIVKTMRKDLLLIKDVYGDRIHSAVQESSKSLITKKQAERIMKAYNLNEKNNEKIKLEFENTPGFKPYNAKHLLKGKLFMECNGICPYTGQTILRAQLFNSYKWEIEHIIPKKQMGGDEFVNLTLCDSLFNRRKDNRTPRQMYQDGDLSEYEYAAIKDRVINFTFFNTYIDAESQPKYKRFVDDLNDDGFLAAQLQDTRYVTRVMSQMIHDIFDVNVKGVKANIVSNFIKSISGHEVLTETLSSFKPGGKSKGESFHIDGGKNRLDHRHHAICAIAAGMVTPKNIKLLNDPKNKDKVLDLRLQIKDIVGNILINHNNNNRVRGQLHQETCYGHTGDVIDKRHFYTYQDERVSTNVKYIEVNYPGNTKCFISGNNHHLPIFKTNNGALVARNYVNKSLNPQVTMFEAFRRKSSNMDIYRAVDIGMEGLEYIDSFHINDMLIMDPEDKVNLLDIVSTGDNKIISPYLYRIEGIDGVNIKLRHHILSNRKADLVVNDLDRLKAEAYSKFKAEQAEAFEELRLAELNVDVKAIKEAKAKTRKRFKFDMPSADIGGFKKSISSKGFKAIKITYNIFGDVKVLNSFNV